MRLIIWRSASSSHRTCACFLFPRRSVDCYAIGTHAFSSRLCLYTVPVRLNKIVKVGRCSASCTHTHSLELHSVMMDVSVLGGLSQCFFCSAVHGLAGFREQIFLLFCEGTHDGMGSGRTARCTCSAVSAEWLVPVSILPTDGHWWLHDSHVTSLVSACALNVPCTSALLSAD